MYNIAIIAEYNPMHNGHIYQIKKIKEKFPDSRIIVIVSGTFVQRGDFSIVNKFYKANTALKQGCDLVIEMPTVASLQSADNFAHISVKILDMLNLVDYLAFGVDSKTIDEFYRASKFLLEYDKGISSIQKKYIDNGQSYKKSFSLAIKELLDMKNIDDFPLDDISNPNNTLAFQYMKSLEILGSKIRAYPILRNDGGFNSKEIDNHIFQSATTIRHAFFQTSIEQIKAFVPKDTYEYLLSLKTMPKKPPYHKLNTIDDLSQIFWYKASIQKASPKNISGYEVGMLNLLLNNFSGSISESIVKSTNKRYSTSRLSRFVLNYLLDISNKTVEMSKSISYIRPLAFNDKGRQILKDIKDKEKIEILIKLSDFYKFESPNKEVIEKDILAYKLIDSNPSFFQYDYQHIPYLDTKKWSYY